MSAPLKQRRTTTGEGAIRGRRVRPASLFVTYVLLSFLFNLFAGASASLMKGLFRLLGLSRYTWADPLVPLVNILLSLAVIFLLGRFTTILNQST